MTHPEAPNSPHSTQTIFRHARESGHPVYAFFSCCLILLSLTACGFHPLYATTENGGGDVDPALAQVQIASIPNREGQELRNLLIDKMQHRGHPADPQYDLTITLQEHQSDMGIRTDATSARSQLTMTARYTLTSRQQTAQVLNAAATAAVGFNKLDAQYSNLSAEEDARRRALDDLSAQITNRLSLYFGAGKK